VAKSKFVGRTYFRSSEPFEVTFSLFLDHMQYSSNTDFAYFPRTYVVFDKNNYGEIRIGLTDLDWKMEVTGF
jgi:hypothetical protein